MECVLQTLMFVDLYGMAPWSQLGSQRLINTRNCCVPVCENSQLTRKNCPHEGAPGVSDRNNDLRRLCYDIICVLNYTGMTY